MTITMQPQAAATTNGHPPQFWASLARSAALAALIKAHQVEYDQIHGALREGYGLPAKPNQKPARLSPRERLARRIDRLQQQLAEMGEATTD